MANNKPRHDGPGAPQNLPQHLVGTYGAQPQSDSAVDRTALPTGSYTAARNDVSDPHPTIPEPARNGSDLVSEDKDKALPPDREDGVPARRPLSGPGSRG